MKNITKKDMNIVSVTSSYLPTDIIVDGRIICRNLVEIDKNDDWLSKQLKKHNLSLSDVSKVFYMSIQEDGETYISLKK